METHSNTAEKIKEYVDRIDTKAHFLSENVSHFIDKAKYRYQQEIDELKLQANLAKAEAKQGYEERMRIVNRRSQELIVESQTFFDEKITPLIEKKDQWKIKISQLADKTDVKWEEMTEEMESLIETTRLAFHNFTETFKQRDKES